MSQAEIGIIGGSGLYDIPGLEEKRERQIDTPFGSPSDAFILGRLEGKRVAFLARHGRGHRIVLLFFEHDPVSPLGRLSQKDGKYTLASEPWGESQG